MNRRLIAIPVVLLVAIGGGTWWWLNRGSTGTSDVVLHGNVEMREVALAFNDSGRVASVLVEEGDRVQQGEVVARLDTSRLMPQLAQAQAQVDAQAAVVAKLKAGSRPEEIAQARATAAAAHADATNAAVAYERARMLSTGSNVSTVTNVEGTMNAGRCASTWARRSSAAGTRPRSGTT